MRARATTVAQLLRRDLAHPARAASCEPSRVPGGPTVVVASEELHLLDSRRQAEVGMVAQHGVQVRRARLQRTDREEIRKPHRDTVALICPATSSNEPGAWILSRIRIPRPQRPRLLIDHEPAVVFVRAIGRDDRLSEGTAPELCSLLLDAVSRRVRHVTHSGAAGVDERRN